MNAEFSVPERRVRTDDFKDETFFTQIALPEAQSRSITERKHYPSGFEPRTLLPERFQTLSETEPLTIELPSLPEVLLVGQQIADPQPRQVFDRLRRRGLGLQKRRPLGVQILSARLLDLCQTLNGPSVDALGNPQRLKEVDDLLLEPGE